MAKEAKHGNEDKRAEDTATVRRPRPAEPGPLGKLIDAVVSALGDLFAPAPVPVPVRVQPDRSRRRR